MKSLASFSPTADLFNSPNHSTLLNICTARVEIGRRCRFPPDFRCQQLGLKPVGARKRLAAGPPELDLQARSIGLCS